MGCLLQGSFCVCAQPMRLGTYTKWSLLLWVASWSAFIVQSFAALYAISSYTRLCCDGSQLHLIHIFRKFIQLYLQSPYKTLSLSEPEMTSGSPDVELISMNKAGRQMVRTQRPSKFMLIKKENIKTFSFSSCLRKSKQPNSGCISQDASCTKGECYIMNWQDIFFTCLWILVVLSGSSSKVTMDGRLQLQTYHAAPPTISLVGQSRTVPYEWDCLIRLSA